MQLGAVELHGTPCLQPVDERHRDAIGIPERAADALALGRAVEDGPSQIEPGLRMLLRNALCLARGGAPLLVARVRERRLLRLVRQQVRRRHAKRREGVVARLQQVRRVRQREQLDGGGPPAVGRVARGGVAQEGSGGRRVVAGRGHAGTRAEAGHEARAQRCLVRCHQHADAFWCGRRRRCCGGAGGAGGAAAANAGEVRDATRNAALDRGFEARIRGPARLRGVARRVLHAHVYRHELPRATRRGVAGRAGDEGVLAEEGSGLAEDGTLGRQQEAQQRPKDVAHHLLPLGIGAGELERGAVHVRAAGRKEACNVLSKAVPVQLEEWNVPERRFEGQNAGAWSRRVRRGRRRVGRASEVLDRRVAAGSRLRLAGKQPQPQRAIIGRRAAAATTDRGGLDERVKVGHPTGRL
mmetsp:Transcript_18387/g.59171  ORF Transcript_18387/g.59171 Transcript_18387/m.59171 type:complete len:412 (+) Transcript_18387:354-1589(+)